MTPSPSTATRADLLLALQAGLPLRARPFVALGRPLGLSEAEVLSQLRDWLATGVARRLGGVFDARRLGYASTLCAADVPAASLDEAAERLIPHPGVTHCYQRNGAPNLWFTLTVPAPRLDAEVQRLAGVLAPWGLISLPARRTFKIGVVLDPRARGGGCPRTAGVPTGVPDGTPDETPLPLDDADRATIRRLQRSLPIVARPFAELAAARGETTAVLLARLAAWQRAGVLRRIGLIVRHRRLGFAANAMCVWRVGADRVEAAGRALAGCPEVTHCYERVAHARFPFNLFAMIHAGNAGAAQKMARRVAAAAGLPAPRLWLSVREFKKSSPLFFEETAGP